MEIHLDTSAINRLNAEKLAQLIKATKARDGLLYVPASMIDEFLACEEDERLMNAAIVLQTLLKQHFNLCRMGQTSRFIWTLEVSGPPVTGTPYLVSTERTRTLRAIQLLAHHNDRLSLASRIRDSIGNQKQLHADPKVGEALKAQYAELAASGRAIGETLEGIADSKPLAWLLEIILAESKSKTTRVSDIWADRRRFATLLAWATLTCLWELSEIIDTSHLNQHPLLAHLRRSRRGHKENDLWDIEIAASAGHGTILLTNDTGLRERCDFLRDKNCVFFEAMELDEFIQQTPMPSGA